MLETLRDRVREALRTVAAATLSTNGPGGIQAGFFPCEAHDLTLYMLVPASSNVIYNLEAHEKVVVTTPGWQAAGTAEVLPLVGGPEGLELVRSERAAGCVLVAICCRRMHFNWSEGWGYRETIDL